MDKVDALCETCRKPISWGPGFKQQCQECQDKQARLDQATVRGPLDLTSSIIAFESGELEDDEVIELFQHLVDTGLAWQLQGFYGRTARDLIEQGLVTA